MGVPVRPFLFASAISLTLASAVSAELNQNWPSGDGSGGDECLECIHSKCATAEPGHAGKSDCVAPHGCDATGCAYPCETSGTKCQGGSSGLERMWVVPNGQPLIPILQQPPTMLTEPVTSCA